MSEENPISLAEARLETLQAQMELAKKKAEWDGEYAAGIRATWERDKEKLDLLYAMRAQGERVTVAMESIAVSLKALVEARGESR